MPAVDTAEAWKPRGTLASRIPALRNYGVVLVIGSIAFMVINRQIWQFGAHTSARTLAYAVYGILLVMLIAGIVILLSKSRGLIINCLNIIVSLVSLFGALALLTFNIIGIVISIVIVLTILNIRRSVKAAA